MAKKSWTEKLNAPDAPVVKPAPIAIAGMRAGQIMLVPTAGMIEAFMRAVPCGETVDIKTMRGHLAERHHTEITCPTGYHLRTVAEAALEAHTGGAPTDAITPAWRVLDETSPTAGRLPCGPGLITERRRLEKIHAA